MAARSCSAEPHGRWPASFVRVPFSAQWLGSHCGASAAAGLISRCRPPTSEWPRLWWWRRSIPVVVKGPIAAPAIPDRRAAVGATGLVFFHPARSCVRSSGSRPRSRRIGSFASPRQMIVCRGDRGRPAGAPARGRGPHRHRGGASRHGAVGRRERERSIWAVTAALGMLLSGRAAGRPQKDSVRMHLLSRPVARSDAVAVLHRHIGHLRVWAGGCRAGGDDEWSGARRRDRVPSRR